MTRFVVEQLLGSVASNTSASFFRTAAEAEIDLLVEFGVECWAIEIKHSSAPAPSRGFHEVCRDINAARKLIV